MTEAAEPVGNAEAAIGRLVESLVISYALDPAAATFTLVTDYPDRIPEAQRSFLALRFSDVHGFRRDPGNLPELAACHSAYSLVDSPRPCVIQHVSLTRHGEVRALQLSLGPNFGEIAFTYLAVAGFVRHACAEKRDGDWVYRDARSGEAFDLARPFAKRPAT